ncbi:MAG: nucleoside deaminase, partial [Candidatus Omnitrophica bacterium]|nr:nucleoside deaminase [Candidatus Omnitrophota bacterium]
MQMAMEKAREGVQKGQTPFGACIVKDNKVLSCVHNTVWKTTDITAHAEVQAIRKACKEINSIDLSGSIIYCLS